MDFICKIKRTIKKDKNKQKPKMFVIWYELCVKSPSFFKTFLSSKKVVFLSAKTIHTKTFHTKTILLKTHPLTLSTSSCLFFGNRNCDKSSKTWSCRRLFQTFSFNCDHYKTLEVKTDASADEIKATYYNLSKKYHPDLNQSAKAGEKFKEITAAYNVLANTENRRAYDKERRDELDLVEQMSPKGWKESQRKMHERVKEAKDMKFTSEDFKKAHKRNKERKEESRQFNDHNSHNIEEGSPDTHDLRRIFHWGKKEFLEEGSKHGNRLCSVTLFLGLLAFVFYFVKESILMLRPMNRPQDLVDNDVKRRKDNSDWLLLEMERRRSLEKDILVLRDGGRTEEEKKEVVRRWREDLLRVEGSGCDDDEE